MPLARREALYKKISHTLLRFYLVGLPERQGTGSRQSDCCDFPPTHSAVLRQPIPPPLFK